MKELILSTGKIDLISDEDGDLIELLWSDTGKYAYRTVDRTAVYLHIIIGRRMGLDSRKTVDHKDRDTYNCQRSNLREATQSEQVANTRMRENVSGYKGVYYDRKRQHWYAQVRRDGITIHVGCYNSSELAARARDRVAKSMFGEFAVLNFPE